MASMLLAKGKHGREAIQSSKNAHALLIDMSLKSRPRALSSLRRWLFESMLPTTLLEDLWKRCTRSTGPAHGPCYFNALDPEIVSGV